MNKLIIILFIIIIVLVVIFYSYREMYTVYMPSSPWRLTFPKSALETVDKNCPNQLNNVLSYMKNNNILPCIIDWISQNVKEVFSIQSSIYNRTIVYRMKDESDKRMPIYNTATYTYDEQQDGVKIYVNNALSPLSPYMIDKNASCDEINGIIKRYNPYELVPFLLSLNNSRYQ